MDYEKTKEIKELLEKLPKEVLIMQFVAHISKESNYHYPSVKNKVQSIIDTWESIDNKY